MMRNAAGAALLVLLAGCSNTVSSLHYVPPATLARAEAPSIGSVTAIDQRKEAPTRLATVLGGVGQPMKTLDTATPVKDEVAAAFLAGLQARSLMQEGSAAPFSIRLTIRKFDADMMYGQTARIDLTLSVIGKDGRVVFEDTATDHESDFKFFQVGIFADITQLQTLCQTVLDRTVNRMLDNPAFRSAIRNAAGTG